MTAIDRPDEPGAAADPQDHALLARLRAGEDAAFGELFSRHCDAVRRMALGMVNDRAEVDDVVAEAFFRVLQAVRRGAGPVDNVRGYLLIVARRVAWEWNARRRDVPVSDEELDVRVGADPDTTGASTERTLITRAFTSLPERWRSVLWKVEVEGERPAVVAGNFGLSPNATAALARRARQGLRAAYLQAHLATGTHPTGCRPVLEKLGAYTAGAVKGAERRRVSSHLSACAGCTASYHELRDVCSGLRAHAALATAPLVSFGLWEQVKAFFIGAKTQIALTGVTAVGAAGLALLPLAADDGDQQVAYDDLDAERAVVLSEARDEYQGPVAGEAGAQRRDGVVAAPPAAVTTSSDAVTTITTTTTAEAPALPVPVEGVPVAQGPGGPTGTSEEPRIDATDDAPFDDSLPIVFTSTSTHRKWQVYDDREVYTVTTRETRVNSANQTTVVVTSTAYTTTKPPVPQLMTSGTP